MGHCWRMMTRRRRGVIRRRGRRWRLHIAGAPWAGRPGSLRPSSRLASRPGRAQCPGRRRGTAACLAEDYGDDEQVHLVDEVVIEQLLALVVLRCALDRRYPALAPLHPDLVFGLQLEGRLIQTSDPNLDERVAGVGCVKEPRPAAGAEAATVIACDLAAHLKRLD